MLYSMLARNYTASRLCNIPIGGLCPAMLIRKLDAAFNMIFHGRWVWFALATSTITRVYPLMRWKATVGQLQAYASMTGYSMMLASPITLVFSRLLWMGEL